MGWDAYPSRTNVGDGKPDLHPTDYPVLSAFADLPLNGNMLDYTYCPQIGHNREPLENLTTLDWYDGFHSPEKLLIAAAQMDGPLSYFGRRCFSSEDEHLQATAMRGLLALLGNRGIGLTVSK